MWNLSILLGAYDNLIFRETYFMAFSIHWSRDEGLEGEENSEETDQTLSTD